ncbi:unnamed protein product [Cylindrotheca closterium]|uniref:DUF6824 domain-containing protein n=1 Tax=Cylindrotheca closterium TaxID=2856 RepID=A0AAD2FHP5_9STRA|nr:unnamed protein product [Cylindrotheca closterium]
MSTKLQSPDTSACCGSNLQKYSISQHSSNENDVEAILIKGMNDLSFDELQREQEELHGVAAKIDATTDVLLQSLEEHLNRIKKGTVLESAEAKNPSSVHRRDFKMAFIRGNRNDPKSAAEQMIRYYDLKQKLFGQEKLTRDITLQDLNEEDMESLMAGHVQLGSAPDRSGRSIAWAFPGLRTDASPLRPNFYIGMDIISLMEDVSRGTVIVSYQVGDEFKEKGNPNFGEAMEAALAMPCNIAAYHFCFSSRVEAWIAQTAVAVMPPHLRAKTKIHYGSHQECLYHLSSYGIPREAFPLTPNYEMDLTYHRFWLQQCIEKEQMNQSLHANDSSSAKREDRNIHFLKKNVKGETPTENDFLCVGRKVNAKGNERLMSLAVMNADAYDTGSLMKKRMIISSMMEEIWRNGGRFLKLDTTQDQGWIKVDDVEMREKIGQTFRNMRYRRAMMQSKAALNGANSGRNGKPVTISRAHAGLSASTKEELTSGASAVHEAIIVNECKDEDVLFGNFRDHAGNRRLRDLVESIASQYDTASRGDKRRLADQILAQVKESRGRFLKPLDDGRWEIVSDRVASQKIGYHFRNLRRKQWR